MSVGLFQLVLGDHKGFTKQVHYTLRVWSLKDMGSCKEETVKLKDKKANMSHMNTYKSHLDGEHGDALWAVDTVPDAEVSPVLGDHHITARHPLDI